MAFTRSNGVVLHYRLHGQDGAPVLVLANSLGTDARIWDGLIDVVSAEYRVLSYDKRGHGLSDAPVGDYSLDDHVADLAGLLAGLGMTRVALCGVSIGGLIVQGYALRYPEQVAALMLCDTASKFGEPADWDKRVAAIRAGGLESIADAIMERWFSPRFRSDHPIELAGWRNLFVRSDADGYCATCATLRDSDLTAVARQIAVPTLAVVGADDKSTPIAMVRACADAISGARFEIIPDAGHIPSIEQPLALAALITGFMREAGHG